MQREEHLGLEGDSCWRTLAGVGEEVDGLEEVSRIYIGEHHEIQANGMGSECGIDYPTQGNQLVA